MTEKMVNIMDTQRKTAKIVGVLFIIATAAGVLSLILLPSFQTAPDNLAAVSASQNQVILGALLILIMAFACASIPIWLYPVLKKYHQTLALGAVGFRIIESVFHGIVVVITLLVLRLSQAFVQAGAPTDTSYKVTSEMFIAANDLIAQIGVFAFGLGALMYYYVFYRSKLVPRWLSGWGVIAILLMITNVVFVLYGYWENFSAISSLLNLPIAIQEMVLAVWLIIKGFNPSEITTTSLSKHI
jgi:hypothetical protein